MTVQLDIAKLHQIMAGKSRFGFADFSSSALEAVLRHLNQNVDDPILEFAVSDELRRRQL